MTSFLTREEIVISEEFEKKGYIIRNVIDKKSLKKIKSFFITEIRKYTDIKKKIDDDLLLNDFHKFIKKENLNTIRLKLISAMQRNKNLRKLYYMISKDFLNTLVGNELSMQQRVNLSIQMPNDRSSLLPVHSDVWSGDSPFEIVVWIPLVDCYKTKTMYDFIYS